MTNAIYYSRYHLMKALRHALRTRNNNDFDFLAHQLHRFDMAEKEYKESVERRLDEEMTLYTKLPYT